MDTESPPKLSSSSPPCPKICPSMLSSDWARLADESSRMSAYGADYLHMDVMDGHFVPNLTIGAPVIKSLRPHTKAYLDCHLMVSNPELWVDDYAKAGADGFTFHIEATESPARLVKAIRERGMRAGVALKPKTPLDALDSLLSSSSSAVDMVLVMTVEPGFGGQKFMADQMEKVKALRHRFPDMDIQVDGGLSLDTIGAAAEAGANVIVAGASIFGAPDPGAVIAEMRSTILRTTAQHTSK